MPLVGLPKKSYEATRKLQAGKFQDGQSGADFLRGLGVSEASAV